ncbi:DMT family transporter [Hydrogenophaga soli]
MNTDTSKWVAYGSLALSMSLVGSYVALSKPLLATFPVFLLALLRFGIGAIAMASWMKKPAHERPLPSSTRWLLFLEAFFGNFLFSVCMLFGMRHTTAVAAGIIMSAIPAVVAALSWLWLKERISWRSWSGIACAAVGVALYSATKHPQPSDELSPLDAHSTWLGNLLILGAVVCEATYAVIGKKLTGSLSAKRISAIINLWGLLMVLPAGLWAAREFAFVSVTPGVWTLLAFYGLAASMWTVWLWMTGLKSVDASQAGIFTVMLPISSALTGVLALGEELSMGQIVAFSIALAGVTISTLPTDKPKPAQH